MLQLHSDHALASIAFCYGAFLQLLSDLERLKQFNEGRLPGNEAVPHYFSIVT